MSTVFGRGVTPAGQVIRTCRPVTLIKGAGVFIKKKDPYESFEITEIRSEKNKENMRFLSRAENLADEFLESKRELSLEERLCICNVVEEKTRDMKGVPTLAK
ncbi:hypothetical protein KIN20_025918 [Parelaphostrongylus tenuis]|uniref:Uncharacterized protein n=1 Tax=Parelaphostrongylus tenuis TaxID=148309 RepID=A0AAD5MW04_PARTN|nr:hypothetical protein KIN20_025918 [Parelaphostrongylus tenuis]